MDDQAAIRRFLQSLPVLAPGERFRFGCDPTVSCFNECCADLNLALTPYDVLLLCDGLSLGGRTFVGRFADVFAAEDTGLPVVMLRMGRAPELSCPFVRPEGCSVYPVRPGACRTYPLGRAAVQDERGELTEHFVIVQEEHCHGFAEGCDWTAEEWLQNQGIAPYNSYNDRYLAMESRIRESGVRLDSRLHAMALLALYQVDSFLDFARRTKLLERLEMSPQRRRAVWLQREEALVLAMDWVELITLGKCAELAQIESGDGDDQRART